MHISPGCAWHSGWPSKSWLSRVPPERWIWEISTSGSRTGTTCARRVAWSWASSAASSRPSQGGTVVFIRRAHARRGEIGATLGSARDGDRRPPAAYRVVHAAQRLHPLLRPGDRAARERGHPVHLAFTRIEKDPGDARSHTLSPTPIRTSPSGRRRFVGAATAGGRSRASCAASPTSADTSTRATRTRPRCARGWPASCPSTSRTARAIDPVTSRATLRLIRFMESQSSERDVAAHRRRARGGRAGDPHGRGHRRLPAAAPSRHRRSSRR